MVVWCWKAWVPLVYLPHPTCPQSTHIHRSVLHVQLWHESTFERGEGEREKPRGDWVGEVASARVGSLGVVDGFGVKGFGVKERVSSFGRGERLDLKGIGVVHSEGLDSFVLDPPLVGVGDARDSSTEKVLEGVGEAHSGES